MVCISIILCKSQEQPLSLSSYSIADGLPARMIDGLGQGIPNYLYLETQFCICRRSYDPFLDAHVSTILLQEDRIPNASIAIIAFVCSHSTPPTSALRLDK